MNQVRMCLERKKGVRSRWYAIRNPNSIGRLKVYAREATTYQTPDRRLERLRGQYFKKVDTSGKNKR